MFSGHSFHQTKPECSVGHLINDGRAGGNVSVLNAQVRFAVRNSVTRTIPNVNRRVVHFERIQSGISPRSNISRLFSGTSLAKRRLNLEMLSLKSSATEPSNHCFPKLTRGSVSRFTKLAFRVSTLCWNKAMRVSLHKRFPRSMGELGYNGKNRSGNGLRPVVLLNKIVLLNLQMHLRKRCYRLRIECLGDSTIKSSKPEMFKSKSSPR